MRTMRIPLRLIIFMYAHIKNAPQETIHTNGFLRLWPDHRRAIIITILAAFLEKKNDDFILSKS